MRIFERQRHMIIWYNFSSFLINKYLLPFFLFLLLHIKSEVEIRNGFSLVADISILHWRHFFLVNNISIELLEVRHKINLILIVTYHTVDSLSNFTKKTYSDW